MSLPQTANIVTAEQFMPNDRALPTDGNLLYPFGLVHFTAEVTQGETLPVELIFETNLAPNQVTARKYNSVKKQYGTVPGAVITKTTSSNGKPALKLTYSIKDGGVLDEDGSENGVIIDPVGLARVISGGTGAPTNGDTPSLDVSPSLNAPNSGYRAVPAAEVSHSSVQSDGVGVVLNVIGGVVLVVMGYFLRRRYL